MRYKVSWFGAGSDQGPEVPTELAVSRLHPASISKQYSLLATWKSWSFPGDLTAHLCVSCHHYLCFYFAALCKTSRLC